MIKLRDYLDQYERELYRVNKEKFNDSMEFTLWLHTGERARINCVYGDCEFDFTIETTIYNLEENRTEILITNLNKIGKLIKDGHSNIDDEVFKNYDNLLKWDCIKITDIDI
ncbi:hypothetical protein [Clostridium sp.]|uniref:hypothetical protein n=1 Tax=Clostridium sp. TaxID=1506 RepID=UPI00262BE5D9|nr:hypothetical protein [Clostridium sp.]